MDMTKNKRNIILEMNSYYQLIIKIIDLKYQCTLPRAVRTLISNQFNFT